MDCFRKRNPIVRPPDAIDAVVCVDCGRIETEGGWARVDLEIAIPTLLRDWVPTDPRASRVTFTHVSRAEDATNFGLSVKAVSRVSESCGHGVPLMAYEGERSEMPAWVTRKGPDGLAEYRAKKNATGIDGLPGL